MEYSAPMGHDADEIAALLPLPPATFHILVAVAQQDRHGHAIIQDVEARTGGELRLRPGTLYRSVQGMLEQGLILETSERPAPDLDDERRRYYRMTPFGEAAARAQRRPIATLARVSANAG